MQYMLHKTSERKENVCKYYYLLSYLNRPQKASIHLYHGLLFIWFVWRKAVKTAIKLS